MSKRPWLTNDPHAAQTTAPLVHSENCLDDIVSVALRIDPAWHGEAHQFAPRGPLAAVGLPSEHDAADLAATNPTFFIERSGKRLSWIVKRRNVCKHRAGV